MAKVANEYVATFTSLQDFLAEKFRAWRKAIHIKRAHQQARLRSLQHNGKKVYIIYDSTGALRVLFREEIIVLRSRNMYTGGVDFISLNRDCVGHEQCNPAKFCLKPKKRWLWS